MNHNMVILCCHILGTPCAASSPKGPLVESLVNDGARPIWPSTAIAWYQHHRNLFPELTVPVPSVPVPGVPVVDATRALNRLVLNDQQDQLQQQGGSAVPPPPPGDHKEQQEVPPEGVPAPPTMFVMSEAQLAKILTHHRGGVQQPVTAAPLAWKCQSTKPLLRVKGAVNTGAYVELSSICHRRIEELKRSASMPRSTTKLSGGFEISDPDPQRVTRSSWRSFAVRPPNT